MGLSLKVLGEFALRDGSGAALSLPTRKTRALLGYLAVNAGKPQQRERLMALLWSDRGEKQARHSLNQALLSLRKLGNDQGVALLDGDGRRVSLGTEAIDVDLARFRSLVDSDPAQAAALYDGPLLDGLAVPDPAFEEWLSATRTAFHNLACGALQSAFDTAAEADDTTEAIALAKRLVTLDPLREDGHRRLMRLLHQSGDRAAALRQYQACADILKKDLQVEPDAATKALLEEIKSDASSSVAPEAPSLAPGIPPTEMAPSLPDVPSIAVLPFDNLGGDPAQDYFGDGIAEDIITDLSRFHSLFVIARGSSFSFKGQRLDTREIATKLGVRYVLEGSLRVHGSRIRITAQLIDAESGRHLWSERYDRETEDIFELQDEFTGNIVGIIEPSISQHERERARLRSPQRLDAWTFYQRAMTQYYSATKDVIENALKLFTEAVQADPSFAAAFAMRADAYVRLVVHGRPEDRGALLEHALESARNAVYLDPRDARSHMALGRVHQMRGEFGAGVKAFDTALSLNPNFAMAHYALGYALADAGRFEEAITAIDRARRLSPHDPFYAGFLTIRSRCLLLLDRYEEAEDWASRAVQCPNPRFWAFVTRAAALRKLGRDLEARAALEEALRIAPYFNLRFARAVLTHLQDDAAREKEISFMRLAGIPE